MRKFTFLLLSMLFFITICSAFSDESSLESDMVVNIHFKDKNLAFIQLKPLHLSYEDVQETWARALVKHSQLDEIQKLGFNVEVLYEDSRDRAAEWREALGDRWTSYGSAVTTMQTTASQHANICRLYDIGRTVQNRTIYVMRITDNPDIDETNEAEVRMAGNIHGDEFISFELMMLLIQYLTDNYGSNPTVTNLVDNRDIWVQPSINPDGHENDTRYNAHGVDLNRDHGYMYSYQSGTGPFSEQELQYFRDWSLNRNFSMSLSFHGVTTYFNYAWNFTGENAWDKAQMESLGNQYTTWNGYDVVEGWDWYQTNGDTNDWSYGCRGDFDVTIETPGYSESHIQTDWNGNRDAILYIIDQAAYGISGVVSDINTGEPLEGLVTIIQKPIMVYTDPVAGDYHRPLQAGTYDMVVWANGYAPITVLGINVQNQQTTVRNVQLAPNYEYFTMHVCWNIIDDHYESYSDSWYQGWPHNALGPPDGIPCSLGRNGQLALDMGEHFMITNNPGNDVIVYETDVGDGDEGFTLYGSSGNFLGPWVLIGTGMGTTEFDLTGTGLSIVRYFKIVDDNNGTYDGENPGYDLDTIGALVTVPGCGRISLDDVAYSCDDTQITITLVDSDLNTNPGTLQSTIVNIYSNSNPAGENVTLTEISVDSDTFIGNIQLSETHSGSGWLLVDRGDLITVQYHDADCQGMPRDVIDTATANCADPILSYVSHSIQTDSGDLDGIWDPGETITVAVTIQNTGTETASGIYGTIETNFPEYVTVDDASSDFPNATIGGSVTSLAPHFTLTASPATPNHTLVTLTLTIFSNDSEDTSTFQIDITSSNFARRYLWNLDINPAWTTQGQWAWGVPQGQSGDPTTGSTGNNVYGYNLAGAYPNNMSETYLTTSAINCSNLTNVEVRFMRWLGIESATYDHASFRVSTNGTTWTTVWDHTGSTSIDTEWHAMTYNISSIASNQPAVYLRWVMGTTDSSVTYGGWNIDDIEIWAESSSSPTNTPTSTPTRTPTFTPTRTPTSVPTVTPTIIPTFTPTMMPTATATILPTSTPTPDVPTPTPSCVHDGDINNSGNLTASDAQSAFLIALGMLSPTPEELCSADCNGNDIVTAEDAQMIFMGVLELASCSDPISKSTSKSKRFLTTSLTNNSESILHATSHDRNVIWIERQSVSDDGFLTVEILLENASVSVSAFTLSLSYDSGLMSFVSCNTGDLNQNWIEFGCHQIEDGIVKIAGYSAETGSYTVIPQGSLGALVQLVFHTTEGSVSDIRRMEIKDLEDDLQGFQIENPEF